MSDKRRSLYFTFEERIGLVETIKKTIDEIELKKLTPLRIERITGLQDWCGSIVLTGFGLMWKEMAANFPEAPKRRNNDWKELWRRKTKTKTKAREKRDDHIETGGGKAIRKF